MTDLCSEFFFLCFFCFLGSKNARKSNKNDPKSSPSNDGSADTARGKVRYQKISSFATIFGCSKIFFFDAQVPLYKGCPYLVNSVAYTHAKHQGPSSFITAILQQLFPTHVLVVSNITGAASKIDPNGFRRSALDRKKMQALKSKRFSSVTVAQGVFKDIYHVFQSTRLPLFSWKRRVQLFGRKLFYPETDPVQFNGDTHSPIKIRAM